MTLSELKTKRDEQGTNRSSQLFCQTHMEVPVGDVIFHVFTLAHNTKRHEWKLLNDRHSHHELIYTMNGEGTYRMLGQTVDVRRGDFWFSPRNVLHDGWSRADSGDWQTLVIEFDFSLAKSSDAYQDDLGMFPYVAPFYKHFILDQNPILTTPPELRPQLDLIVERLSLEMQSRSTDFPLIVQSSMIELLVLICRAARETISESPVRQFAPKARRLLRLEGARQHLRDNFAKELTLEEVAAVACFSPFHFLRLFKEAFGITPKKYQAQLRLAEAKRLLLNSDMQVSEIAYKLGYSSPEYFSRCFTSHASVAPSEFAELQIKHTKRPRP